MRESLRRWRTPLLAALVAILTGTLVWLLWFSDHLDARGVEVDGVSTVSPERVREQAKVPMGTQLARLDTDAIRARVESIATIERAEVSRSWPHTLSITVTERIPVALVQRGTKTQAVDLHGVVFPGSGSTLPRIRTSEEANVDTLAQGAKVAKALPPQLRERLDYIDLESIDTIRLQLQGGRSVVWGSSADSVDKARVAQALLKGKARVIDVSVPGRPTTR